MEKKMKKEMMCLECGATNTYEFRDTTREYEGDGYHFELIVTVPFCKVCGAPIYDEGLEREIAQKANEMIRQQCGIITRDEILEILERYNVSQKFLSRLMGWGEITLTRYISGNYTPNAANSSRLKELKNPYVFQMLLQNFHDERIGKEDEKLFKKAQAACQGEINKVEEKNGKIFSVVNWFLSQSSEDAPLIHLALQKLLYFVQGWSRALLGEAMFADECQAGVQGLVYPAVYDIFKQFGAAPLPRVEEMSAFEEREQTILNAVKRYYFDIYCTKALEEICHREEPYIEAAGGIRHTVMAADRIFAYYSRICQIYNISMENMSNVKTYLNTVLD